MAGGAGVGDCVGAGADNRLCGVVEFVGVGFMCAGVDGVAGVGADLAVFVGGADVDFSATSVGGDVAMAFAF